jgi:hypothetical protein
LFCEFEGRRWVGNYVALTTKPPCSDHDHVPLFSHDGPSSQESARELPHRPGPLRSLPKITPRQALLATGSPIVTLRFGSLNRSKRPPEEVLKLDVLYDFPKLFPCAGGVLSLSIMSSERSWIWEIPATTSDSQQEMLCRLRHLLTCARPRRRRTVGVDHRADIHRVLGSHWKLSNLDKGINNPNCGDDRPGLEIRAELQLPAKLTFG